jgi:hypothetical protein
MANQSKAINMGPPYTRQVQFILTELIIQSTPYAYERGLQDSLEVTSNQRR